MEKQFIPIEFEIIWKSIHDELSPEEESMLKAWLSQDPRHQWYYDQAKGHYSQETAKPASPAIDSLWASIAERELTAPQKNISYSRAIAACVVLIVASVIGYLMWQPAAEKAAVKQANLLGPGKSKAILILPDGQQIALGANTDKNTTENQQLVGLVDINDEAVLYKEQVSSNVSKEALHILNVPRGGEFMLQLADGTRVWLNSESSIEYPTLFTGQKRVVTLSGEAYFEVTENKEKPFEVVTGKQTIRVLGTSFNVNYYPEEGEIVSTLLKGKIQVNTTNGSQTTVAPGEQVVFDLKKELVVKKSVNVENYIAWKNGQFYFQNRSLEHIMTVLARWYDIDVFYKNGEKKNIRFTGNLKRYERFEEVIELIEATDDVKFENKGNVIIIE
ncbi:MAG: DUF4974 domain-containing protein [Marinoscillum sp.]